MPDESTFQHPRFARMYERISAESERRGGAQHRERVLAELSGRVIEVGAGNGLNFRPSPHTVTEVIAVEPEDRLRALADKAAESAAVPIRVTNGHAEALPAEDGSCDAAVASLVLCSVPNLAGTLAELRRVLRPGGDLRFYEHVRSANPWTGRVQDVITPVWSRAAGGCRLNRDTASALQATGFEIDELDRFTYVQNERSPFPRCPQAPSEPGHRRTLGKRTRKELHLASPSSTSVHSGVRARG